MLFPIIVLFIIGTIFGSFLSVVIARIRTQKKGIFLGKSECPDCGKRLNAVDLIPIFGYIINKGKCKYCHKKISPHYPLLELITGLMFVAFFIKFPFIDFEYFGTQVCGGFFCQSTFTSYIYNTTIGLFLIGIFFYDLKYMEIPEIFTFPAIGIIFVGSILFPEPGMASMAIGGASAGLFFGIQVWLSKETWLGKGDTQVGILMGMLFGFKLFIVSLIIIYLIGLITTVPLLIAKKVTKKTRIPFAPFMVISTFITLFFGEFLYSFYFDTLL